MRSLRAACSLLFAFFLLGKAHAASTIDSRTAVADGVKLHYLVSGSGPPVISCTATRKRRACGGRSFRASPRSHGDRAGLAGDRDSTSPGRPGHEERRGAHPLARQVTGVEKARWGHDIGLMVAYAYAAQFPAERKSSS